MKTVVVYTDGSAIAGKVGYGIHFPNGEYNDISGTFGKGPFTNNRAELMAIYRAMRIVTKKLTFDKLIIFSDSEYSVKSITIWIKNWKKNGWKNSKKQPVKNKDIISKIDALKEKFSNKIEFLWTKAHCGNKHNDRADELARKGIEIKI